MGLSQARLSVSIRVPAKRVSDLVLGKRRITADMALRLSQYFGTSAQFWMGLQADYDLDVATDQFNGRLKREIKAYAPAAA